MPPQYVILFLLALVPLVFIGRRIFRQQRCARAAAQPFPAEWDAIISENVPLAKHLPPSLLEQLRQRIKIFLAEKRFEGCGGLSVTDEIRVTIAAHACLLLLNRDERDYPKLSTILVYPRAFVNGRSARSDPRANVVRSGESWHSGAVVLAWSHVRSGARDIRDGHNVALHEFAHQLDQEDGAADGAPLLPHRSDYAPWARILGTAYQNLMERTKKGRRTLMDDYGTTNPAEFFAVATETFFEKGEQMREKHPDLYEELKDYYHTNPADWSETTQDGGHQ